MSEREPPGDPAPAEPPPADAADEPPSRLPDLRARPRLRRGLLAAVAVVVGLVYLAPQLRFIAAGYEGTVFLHVDEPSYAARVQRCAQGRLAPADAWTWEHRDGPSVLPTLQEASLASLTLFGLSVDAVVVVGRFLLAALGVVAIYLALTWLGFAPGLALGGAAWVYLDAGAMHYKPLLHLVLGQAGLPFNRFLNPLFGLPLFFLCFGLAGRAFLREEHHRRDALLAGALLGASFYVSIYYWSHAIPALVLAALVLRTPHRWKVLGWGALATAVVALPYAVSLAQLRAHPVYPDIPWRNGLGVAERGWYLLPNKTLWLFVLAAGALLRGAAPRERYLLAGVGAGLACYFSTLLTGRSFQNFHWAYTLAPLLYLAAFALLARGWERLPPARRPAAAAVLIAASLLNLGAALGSVERQHRRLVAAPLPPGVGVSDQGYRPAWDWLRANAEPGAVVLCDPQVQPLVPARTGLRVWQASCVELLTFQELLDRHQVQWALMGLDAEALRRRLDPGAHPVAQWGWGLPAARAVELRAAGRPAFDRELAARLADELAAAQAALDPAAVRARAGEKRLDYLVRGPREANWGDAPERWLKLERVLEAGQVRVDRVVGWRAP